MVRRLIVVAALAAVAILMLVPAGASAAATGVCVLKGTANIPAGLGTAAKPITYTFNGTFTNCQGIGTMGVKSAYLTASGSGTGSCTANNTAGTAFVYWNTGAYSMITFTTVGTGTLVRVVGRFTAGLFTGRNAKAFLGFYTLMPQACTKPGGLKTASFIGPATLGI